MPKIMECLTDPSWWFTAVVVAFLMSLFAGLLIKPLLRLIATRSKRVRTWLAEKSRRLDERADAIVKDPTRILIAHLDVIICFCFIILMLTVAGFFLCTHMLSVDLGRTLTVVTLLMALVCMTLSTLVLYMRLIPSAKIVGRITSKLNAKGNDTPNQPETPAQS